MAEDHPNHIATHPDVMMRSRTCLIVGPAGAGKTRAALRAYVAAGQASRPARKVWLTPSGRSAAQVSRSLLGTQGNGAILGPGVHTFSTLAGAVLRASRQAVRRLGPLEKRELIAELLDDAMRAGRLRYFAPIAEARGLVDLVSQFIADWKRLEIWPDELHAAAERRGMTPKDTELVTIYSRYQALLEQHDWFDAEGQIWLARALLRDGQSAPFAQLDCLVADGFSDFTRTEQEILELLAARSAQTLVTLVDEPGDERAELFAKARRTAQQFRERHADCETIWLERRSNGGWPAREHFERRLFGHPRHAVDAATADRIEILAAGRELGEIELIAARVKALLADGDPEDGRAVAPGEIVVAFRSLEPVAALVRAAFTEFGIPFYLEKARRLLDVPLVAALLQLVRLQADDWPYRGLLATLNQNYFRPSWPTWNDAAVRDAELLVRRIQIPRGRAAILAACERNSAADNAGFALLKRLVAAVDALPERASIAEWIASLQAVANELGYFASPDQEDRVAWQLIGEAAAGMARMRDALGTSQSLSVAEFADWFKDVASITPMPQEHDEVGRVRILAAASLRALEAPYLFLGGLSERSFPAADREGSVYSDAECRALAAEGLPLPTRHERAQDEMLLFYETLTRAQRRLWLSYPAIDERAQPWSPSPYLVEVERSFGKTAIPRWEAADLRPIPAEPRVWRERDWRLRGVIEAAEGNATTLAALVAKDDAHGVASNLLAGLIVVRERATGRGFGAFEGVLESAEAKAACAARFDAERVWSATELELYGECPFKFFLARVLGVHPLDEAYLRTDYQGRGARMHQALAGLHRWLNLAHAPGTSPHALDIDSYTEVIDRLLTDGREGEDGERSLSAALGEIERLELREWLLNYPQQHSDYAGATGPAAMQPTYFEAAFGMRRERREDEPARDELSVDECLELRHGADRVRIAGRIDRIDVAEFAGEVVFNVLDYKTGKTPTKSEITNAVALQLPLYALAVERLLLGEHEARPWQIGYWSLSEKGFKSGCQLWVNDGDRLAPTQPWRDLLAEINRRVFALVRGVRGGEFPMYNEDKKCAARCDFRRVCRVNQTRGLEKSWQPPAEHPSV